MDMTSTWLAFQQVRSCMSAIAWRGRFQRGRFQRGRFQGEVIFRERERSFLLEKSYLEKSFSERSFSDRGYFIRDVVFRDYFNKEVVLTAGHSQRVRFQTDIIFKDRSFSERGYLHRELF